MVGGEVHAPRPTVPSGERVRPVVRRPTRDASSLRPLRRPFRLPNQRLCRLASSQSKLSHTNMNLHLKQECPAARAGDPPVDSFLIPGPVSYYRLRLVTSFPQGTTAGSLICPSNTRGRRAADAPIPSRWPPRAESVSPLGPRSKKAHTPGNFFKIPRPVPDGPRGRRSVFCRTDRTVTIVWKGESLSLGTDIQDNCFERGRQGGGSEGQVGVDQHEFSAISLDVRRRTQSCDPVSPQRRCAMPVGRRTPAEAAQPWFALCPGFA
jgi:hypothetical protein